MTIEIEYDECCIKSCSVYENGKCKTNTKNGCGKIKAYRQGREEREEEIIDLIYYFEKTWNKESHKKVPHIAISELVEFIMQNDTKESVDRKLKEKNMKSREDVLKTDLDIPQHFTKGESEWIKKYCIKRNIEFYNQALEDVLNGIKEILEDNAIYNIDCIDTLVKQLSK